MDEGPGPLGDSRILVERIQRGDEAAEELFAARYLPRTFVLLLTRTRDPEVARDLAQDVVVIVLKALREGKLRNPESLAAFLHGTANNLVSEHRRERRRPQIPNGWMPGAPTVAPDEILDRAERAVFVRRALRRLGATDRTILLLALVEGLAPAEIAARLGVRPDAVRQRKSRAMRRILKAMKEWSRR